MKKFTFTEKRVAELQTPPTGRLEVQDAKTPGLVLRLTANGSRSYSLFKRVNGRLVRITLGSSPQMTLDAARKAVNAYLTEMAKGIDPAAVKRAKREEPTFGDLWAYWLENHAKQFKRPSSVKGDEWQYNKFLKPWASRKLSAVTHADAASLHKRIGNDSGPYQANRVLALVSSMYGRNLEHSKAIGYTGDNPAKGVRKFKEEKRDRFLSGDELAKFLRRCTASPARQCRTSFCWPC